MTEIRELESQLKSLGERAESEIEEADSLSKLEGIRVSYLGKKGKISVIMKEMGRLSPPQRPLLGAIANEIKERIQEKLKKQQEKIQEREIEKKIKEETLDVTMPGVGRRLGRIHPIQSTIDRIVDIFVGMGYTVAEGPQIETDYYNFTALNTPEDHPARDMQDTFYFEDGTLLRTHTSSVQIRYMEKHKPPIRIVAPGRVYRRDTVDATHSAVFHQVEILAVGEGLTFTDLKGTIKEFLRRMFGEDLPTVFRASYFPFTEPSAEVDVQWQGKWLEVLGCGMVDPNVLKAVGYDPEKYTGFAAGLGVERFAMILHKIDDIRRLYQSDLRFLRQF
ncbi:MAG: phenylalanine--tRNA ligase subunit alpha [Geminocystis sp.]|nr:phenylalanine--tRNA ligase subunit alpha [Geminocystis sp.]HIK37472.1 phenylalanine--tRNA ligase subunit alpha [Geminocystis sp. M7585_C2015_104]MCS7147666.1 phenylalanine--tRNA ligase subunit alpha [Geminocystis sp.]MCX8078491.1 phenylalanine--tRNA ligase subunit alpha [Geminocystis sp.]MDW8117220.1 phenylalanine--tRNA ligase subunit alpha [Geminocystis sp.]